MTEQKKRRLTYDMVFSGPILPVFLLIAGIFWLGTIIRRRSYAEGVVLVLPALYIFLTCVLFERGENMRFKYFLEPVMLYSCP